MDKNDVIKFNALRRRSRPYGKITKWQRFLVVLKCSDKEDAPNCTVRISKIVHFNYTK